MLTATIAAVTSGKRLARMPSESGSMGGSVAVETISRHRRDLRAVAGNRATSQPCEKRAASPLARRFGNPRPERQWTASTTSGGRSMETTLDQIRHQVRTQVTKARWALGISGVLSVLFAVVILVW